MDGDLGTICHCEGDASHALGRRCCEEVGVEPASRSARRVLLCKPHLPRSLQYSQESLLTVVSTFDTKVPLVSNHSTVLRSAQFAIETLNLQKQKVFVRGGYVAARCRSMFICCQAAAKDWLACSAHRAPSAKYVTAAIGIARRYERTGTPLPQLQWSQGLQQQMCRPPPSPLLVL